MDSNWQTDRDMLFMVVVATAQVAERWNYVLTGWVRISVRTKAFWSRRCQSIFVGHQTLCASRIKHPDLLSSSLLYPIIIVKGPGMTRAKFILD